MGLWGISTSAGDLRHTNCMQLQQVPMSLIRQRSKSEVMTAMMNEKMVGNDKDRFTMTELAALRSDLIQGGMVDSYEAAELLCVFLMGCGFVVYPIAAIDVSVCDDVD